MNRLKEMGLPLLFLILGLVLILSGLVLFLSEGQQFIVKKAFLLGFWYVVTYFIRVFRVGHIDWAQLGEMGKAMYYFVLLLGSAIIIAWG